MFFHYISWWSWSKIVCQERVSCCYNNNKLLFILTQESQNFFQKSELLLEQVRWFRPQAFLIRCLEQLHERLCDIISLVFFPLICSLAALPEGCLMMFHSSLPNPFWHSGKHTLLSDVSKLVSTSKIWQVFFLDFFCLFVCLLLCVNPFWVMYDFEMSRF